MNYTNSNSLESTGDIVVTLDSENVALPPGRRSLNSVRSYLETVALANRRILGDILLDGRPIGLLPISETRRFQRIDAVTIPLCDLPLVLLTTASQQVVRARELVESALTLVLINDPDNARELWWKIASQLKEPVLTLSLMPEYLCQRWCGTTFQRLREWQLEQIASIIRRVDQSCDSNNTILLSDSLEQLVLPWLDKLADHIVLWKNAASAGSRLEGGPN